MYKGTCPVCNKEFLSEDEIVVCPVCGAPHHKSCYSKNDGCFYQSLHTSGFEYKAQNSSSENENHSGSIICPNCKKENLPDAIFCTSCGSPIHMTNASAQGNSTAFQSSPFTAPYTANQTYDENDNIDDIKTKHYASYIGSNPQYYIAHFKRFSSQKTKTSFNFTAFLVPPIFFLFRKMWAMAAVAVSISIVVMLPSIYEIFSVNGQIVPILSSLFQNIDGALYFQYITMIISTVTCVLFGLFANYLYFKKSKKAIIKTLQKSGVESDDTIKNILTKKGGVSIVAIMTYATALFILFTTLLFFMT